MSEIRMANEAWEALFAAQVALLRRFAADDVWGEVSLREYDALYTLAKADRPIRIGELGQGVLLSQPALSRLVDRLAERGLVARTGDPDDRRICRVELTEAGRDVQRRVGRAHGARVAEAMTEALDPAELAELAALCRRLAPEPSTSSTRPLS